MTTELKDEVHTQVVELCKSGDSLLENGNFTSGIQSYIDAFNLLPPPISQWDAATWILAALGDAYFLKEDYEEACKVFSDAMCCPNAIGNPFLHLRLGQTQYELNNKSRAADELARAFMGGGEELFKDEDSKYLNWIKAVLDSNSPQP
jgi:tetratricopeptide (TPR) repeat protein